MANVYHQFASVDHLINQGKVNVSFRENVT